MKTVPIELTEQYIEAVKRALADASVPVYYDEATLPDYVDIFLTPLESVLDERNATVLGWREETGGWRVVDFTDGEITDGFAPSLPLFADPTDVAREVAGWLGVDEPAETETRLDPATRDDVMRYLAGGIVYDKLPGPVQIHTRSTYAGVIAEDLTDAHTWIAWLGCGALHTDTYTLGEGRRYERTWSEVAWFGWTIRVSLTRTAVTR